MAPVCKACGATLPSDVPWCGQCGMRVTRFAPRPAFGKGEFVGLDRPDRATSRWRSSATSFGSFGRLVLTLGMLLFLAFGILMVGPASPFTIWFLFGWMAVAVLVVPQVWKRVPVPEDERAPGLRSRLGSRLPSRLSLLVAPIPPLVSLGLIVVLAVGGALAMWGRADRTGRFAIVAVLSMLGLGLALSRLISND